MNALKKNQGEELPLVLLSCDSQRLVMDKFMLSAISVSDTGRREIGSSISAASRRFPSVIMALKDKGLGTRKHMAQD